MKKKMILSALFLLALTHPIRADELARIDRLILNGGERIRLQVSSVCDEYVKIKGGSASRVPRKPVFPLDLGKNVVEMDVETRQFSLMTNAEQLLISGASHAEIRGIVAESWGTYEAPALGIDRDCAVTLQGRADTVAVIWVDPLARVVIDARKLSTPEIKIIGNLTTGVLNGKDTNVVFYRDERKPTVAVSGSGTDETGSASEEPAEIVVDQPVATPPEPTQAGQAEELLVP